MTRSVLALCLLLVLLTLAAGCFQVSLFGKHGPQITHPEPPPAAPSDETNSLGPRTTHPEPPPGDEPEEPAAATPDTEAALAKAKQLMGDGLWHAKLVGQTEDGTEVAIWCQADKSTYDDNYWVMEVGLFWDSGDEAWREVYIQMVSQVELSDAPAEETLAPRGSGPTKLGALGEILDGEEELWFANVESRTADWSRCTAWIGPPESEYVYIKRVEWDSGLKQYIVLQVKELNGTEAGPTETKIY